MNTRKLSIQDSGPPADSDVKRYQFRMAVYLRKLELEQSDWTEKRITRLPVNLESYTYALGEVP